MTIIQYRLQRRDVDLFLLNMLDNNKPYGLLPYGIERREDEVILSYDPRGKASLQELLEVKESRGPLRMEEALALLQAALRALGELEDYFIFEDSLFASPDRIFFQEDGCFFVCSPAKERVGKEGKGGLLHGLGRRLSRSLTEEDQFKFLEVEKRLEDASLSLADKRIWVQKMARSCRNKIDQVDYYASLPELQA